MKTVKKTSAFSVFKKKEVSKTGDLKKEKGSTEINRSASCPSVTKADLKSNKFMKVLKGSSLRSSSKSSGRPSVFDSPFVAGSTNHSVRLTSLQHRLSSSSRFVAHGSSAGKLPENKPLESSDHKFTSPAPVKTRSKRLHTLSSDNNVPTKRKKIDKDFAELSTEEIEKTIKFDEEIPLPYMYDSACDAKKAFECLIHPVNVDKFFKELWERKPLLVKRHMTQYNDGWFSMAEMERILKENSIQYGVNLDITTYENGKRETHNPAGRAYAPVVWDYYQNGCSVRLLNPQTYSRSVWKLLAMLQEYFGCMAGANVYLTPPDSQGFAPHYDDIEAFVVQLEGKKHWKLYSPRNDAENLPRYSSPNFSVKDVGDPILDVVLEAGDLLYFPRGTIHQAKTMSGVHSLHITISCYQLNSWGDLLEKLVPQALQAAIADDVEFRKGLPRNYLNFMGVANSDMLVAAEGLRPILSLEDFKKISNILALFDYGYVDCNALKERSSERKTFHKTVERLMSKLFSCAPVDAACDQLGKRFIHDSLPAFITEDQKSCSVHDCGAYWNKKKQQVSGAVEIEPDTTIKLIRRGVIRLTIEDDVVRVYHSLENSRTYHEKDPQFVEIPFESAPALEFLIRSYPEYVTVDSLPLDTLQDRIDIATVMFEKGLLITGEPLQPLDEDCSSSELEC